MAHGLLEECDRLRDMFERMEDERDAALARAEKAEALRDEAIKKYGDCVVKYDFAASNYLELVVKIKPLIEALERIAHVKCAWQLSQEIAQAALREYRA